MLNEWPQDNKFCTRVKGRYRLCNMIVDWDINQQLVPKEVIDKLQVYNCQSRGILIHIKLCGHMIEAFW